MSDEGTTTGAVPDPGCMDRIGHLLIRAYNGDTFDPFFIDGHPNLRYREDRLVRSCFYYSVVVSPKLTVLYDNDGAGGMCEIAPHEISAVWRTPKLMESLGIDFDDLLAGRAVLAVDQAPPPCWKLGAEDYKADGDEAAQDAPGP